MVQKREVSEWLTKIEKKFFSGEGLAEASMLKGDECRTYVLAQVERLLSMGDKHTPEAMYLSDTFWTADEGRHPIRRESSELLSKSAQSLLTADERRRLQLILKVAGLCHDLSLHFMFDVKEAFGISRKSFWVSNKRLVEFLRTTEYEQIAVHTAYIMKKHAIDVYECRHYMPAQDDLAEQFSMKYMELVGKPGSTGIPPRDYVCIILDELQRIERHWQRGRRLKLNAEVVMLHDEIYSVVPRQFDKGVLAAAQVLYDYLDSEVQGRLMAEGYDPYSSLWSQQPESVRRVATELMKRFAEKVREVREKYLAEGWIDDNSLSFSYLMAHAERCGRGWWNKEDAVL